MTDLSERLLNLDITRQFSGAQLPLIEEAADEIDRLKAQIALEQEYSDDLCKKGGEQEAEIERLKDELDAERYDSMFKDKEIERLQERFDLALRKNGEQWAEIEELRQGYDELERVRDDEIERLQAVVDAHALEYGCECDDCYQIREALGERR